MLKVLRKLLVEAINLIDSGDCHELSTEEGYEMVTLMKKFMDARSELTRTEAAKYLNIGQSTFDRRVMEGKIPKGIKKAGRNPYWTKKMLDRIIGDK